MPMHLKCVVRILIGSFPWDTISKKIILGTEYLIGSRSNIL